MRPFFSIVIPTRDRKDYVDINLFYLTKQNFEDFEVIISDNHINESCSEIVEKYKDKRFICVTPEKPLNMNENWEFALGFVKGKYVIYLEDKMFLYPNSLKKIYKIIKEQSEPDIVDWNWDYFNFEDETIKKSGYVNRKIKNAKINEIGVLDIIKYKVGFNTANSYQDEEGTPGIGKVLSAAIKIELFSLISKKYKSVFSFINPDYGINLSMLFFSKKTISIDTNFTILIPMKTSNGNICPGDNNLLRNFVESTIMGKKIMEKALIENSYCSATNVVLAEYIYSMEILGLKDVSINKKRALSFIHQEFLNMTYTDYDEREKDRTEILKLMKENGVDFIEKDLNKQIKENNFKEKLRKNKFIALLLDNYRFYIKKSVIKIDDIKKDYKKLM